MGQLSQTGELLDARVNLYSFTEYYTLYYALFLKADIFWANAADSD